MKLMEWAIFLSVLLLILLVPVTFLIVQDIDAFSIETSGEEQVSAINSVVENDYVKELENMGAKKPKDKASGAEDDLVEFRRPDSLKDYNRSDKKDTVVAESTKDEEKEEEHAYDEVGYASIETEIYADTNSSGLVIDTCDYQEKIEYDTLDNKWAVVETDTGEKGYILLDELNDKKDDSSFKKIYGDRRKSYESYHAIGAGKQLKLQQMATTNEDGGRMVNNRYLVACGSALTHDIGQYMDVVLSNGTIIPCVVGDAKANVHTDPTNMIGLDGSVIEFIVDPKKISNSVRQHGNMDYANIGWDARAVSAIIYETNLFGYYYK